MCAYIKCVSACVSVCMCARASVWVCVLTLAIHRGLRVRSVEAFRDDLSDDVVVCPVPQPVLVRTNAVIALFHVAE